MAAGAGQPHRRTFERARECCESADAVHAPAELTHKPPTEAPARGAFLLSGAGATFGQVAYRLPTSNGKEKTPLPY